MKKCVVGEVKERKTGCLKFYFYLFFIKIMKECEVYIYSLLMKLFLVGFHQQYCCVVCTNFFTIFLVVASTRIFKAVLYFSSFIGVRHREATLTFDVFFVQRELRFFFPL